jgi:hypothetical protein
VSRWPISGEVWHFSQPFEKGNTVGNLWAVSRALRKNLVVDGGFNRGLTRTSTRWETFVGSHTCCRIAFRWRVLDHNRESLLRLPLHRFLCIALFWIRVAGL